MQASGSFSPGNFIVNKTARPRAVVDVLENLQQRTGRPACSLLPTLTELSWLLNVMGKLEQNK
jgi:hypothetical protein